MTKEIVLLPCPFCGGKAEMEQNWFHEDFVFCIACGAMTLARKTREEAAKIWNTRIVND